MVSRGMNKGWPGESDPPTQSWLLLFALYFGFLRNVFFSFFFSGGGVVGNGSAAEKH